MRTFVFNQAINFFVVQFNKQKTFKALFYIRRQIIDDERQTTKSP